MLPHAPSCTELAWRQTTVDGPPAHPGCPPQVLSLSLSIFAPLDATLIIATPLRGGDLKHELAVHIGR